MPKPLVHLLIALLVLPALACDGEGASAPAPTGDTGSTADSGTTDSSTLMVITTPSAVIVDPPPVAVAADVETLAFGDVTGVAALDPFTQLVTTPSELVAIDAFGALDVWASTPGRLQAAVRWGESVLLVADGALHDFDGVNVRPSVLADAVGPAHTAWSWQGDLWIGADQGLVRWRGGELVLVTVGGAAVGAFAVGGEVRGNEVTWVAQGDVLHALGNAGSTWVDLEAVKLVAPIDSVAVDANHVAWAAAGGWAFRRDPAEGWQRLDFGQPVWEVHAHPDAPGAWLEAESGWLFDDAGTWQEITGLPAPSANRPPKVDGAGRLMVWNESGAMRGSTTRPLVVVGLEQGEVVGRITDVTLLPTAPDAVEELRAVLVDSTGAEVPVSEVSPGVVRVDPDGLANGAWTFRAEAVYDGRTSIREVGVFVGAAFEPTWANDIEPIYRTDCAFCHGGDADTVLEEPEDWEPIIEAIVYNVQVGNMPLGGDPLSDVEVVLIEAWRDAGFPR